jgi:hypothetical protein
MRRNKSKGADRVLTIARGPDARPIEIAVVREAIRLRPSLRIRAEGGSLVGEAVIARRLFDSERGKPIAMIPVSDTEFAADSRSGTRIAFTLDAAAR